MNNRRVSTAIAKEWIVVKWEKVSVRMHNVRPIATGNWVVVALVARLCWSCRETNINFMIYDYGVCGTMNMNISRSRNETHCIALRVWRAYRALVCVVFCSAIRIIHFTNSENYNHLESPFSPFLSTSWFDAYTFVRRVEISVGRYHRHQHHGHHHRHHHHHRCRWEQFRRKYTNTFIRFTYSFVTPATFRWIRHYYCCRLFGVYGCTQSTVPYYIVPYLFRQKRNNIRDSYFRMWMSARHFIPYSECVCVCVCLIMNY